MHTNDQRVKLTVKDAGRLGGLTTLVRRGLDHYREAGRKGPAPSLGKHGRQTKEAKAKPHGGERADQMKGGMGARPVMSPPSPAQL